MSATPASIETSRDAVAASRSSLASQAVGYDLLALAGRGAFAEVWLAQEQSTGRLVALKAIHDECPNPRTACTLLANEAEIARRIDSAHVVCLLGARLDASPPFLVLEWLSGETLEARLAREPTLPCRDVLWIGRQVAQGLADLAAAGYIHGDVKPSNIFICRSGAAKLIDLGFARPDQREPAELGELMATFTGTPEYLAPEALVPAEQQGIARDLYALGITMYRALTGVAPFRADTVAEAVRRQQTVHPPRIRTVVPGTSPEVEDLVHRLLSKQPLRRGEGPARLVRELVGLELTEIAA